MSAQQKKLFILKTKVGAVSQSKVAIPQAQTSRKQQQQRLSTKLPKYSENQIMFSPINYVKQKTVLNFSIVGLDDFQKNVIKYHSFKSFDGQDYRRYKIKCQDYLFNKTMMGEGNGKHFFILNDGHGTQGLHVAKLIGQQLEILYSDFIQRLDQINIKDEKMQQEIVQMYKTTDEFLNQKNEIDCSQSGTSNISLFIIGDQMLCSNCGDSKALFFYKNDFQEKSLHLWRIKQLSSDHLPSKENEFQRIRQQNGRIDQRLIRGKKLGNLLIWSKLKTDQGVHVTRCFGNQLHKNVGVIVDPEISYYKFPKSGYLIIATQSLWNYIDNYDIGQIFNKYDPPKSQSEISRIENEIITHANHFWDGEHDGIQDISFTIIYIDLQL